MAHVNQFTSRPQDFPAGDPMAAGAGHAAVAKPNDLLAPAAGPF
jgi:hypothetical protein